MLQNPILDYKQLQSEYFPHIKSQSLLARLSRKPKSLPPFFEMPGVKGYFWLREVVDGWFRSLQPESAKYFLTNPIVDCNVQENSVVKKKLGRPSNAERLRKHNEL